METRRQQAERVRINAAKLAANRPHPRHLSNGEEFTYRRPIERDRSDSQPEQQEQNSELKVTKTEPSYIANFTKGLPHDRDSGLLLNSTDYRQFVKGIQSGNEFDFAKTPLGAVKRSTQPAPGCLTPQEIECNTSDRLEFWDSQIARDAEDCQGAKVRAWESASAGFTFDLEGADAQAVTMPPAPTMGGDELAAEMTEVYLQALLRDVHFSQFRSNNREEGISGTQHNTPECNLNCNYTPLTVDDAVTILNEQKWFNTNCCDLSLAEQSRSRQPVSKQTIFRGITPGDTEGPYISQFLLIGNTGVNPNDRSAAKITNGAIAYGSIRIDQKVRLATPCKDYMTTFESWVDVQNGADLRGLETYVNEGADNQGKPQYRFIATPRDLATYVHYDALYEAYLNACLVMLGMGVPFDPGIPFQQPDAQDKQQGFALFGAPQILTLVCEVATRALKAVRYQKFNIHRRLRPEAVGGLIHRFKNSPQDFPLELEPVEALVGNLSQELLNKVKEHNKCQNDFYSEDRGRDNKNKDNSYLLPMAFAEGSPMHPSYGAGHATVAGACVTVLKAFFDSGFIITPQKSDTVYLAYESDPTGNGLDRVRLSKPLTVEGELNKLASNISIGRDWAGVHYFSDYIESLRMGEQIAIAILEEQKLTYRENFTMTIPLFDGGTIRI